MRKAMLGTVQALCVKPIVDDYELQQRMAYIDQLYAYSSDIDDTAATLAELIADKVYEYEKKKRDVC